MSKENLKTFTKQAANGLGILETNCLKQSRDAIDIDNSEGHAGEQALIDMLPLYIAFCFCLDAVSAI